MTEKHLQAILSQGRKVLVEAWVHEPQQLSQVHLEKMLSAQPPPSPPREPPTACQTWAPAVLAPALPSHKKLQLAHGPVRSQLITAQPGAHLGLSLVAGARRPLQLFHKEGGRVKRKSHDSYIVKRKKGRESG